MRTTIDIPDDLLAEARTYLKQKSKRDLVVRALEEAIRREKIERFLSLSGTLEVEELDRAFTRGRPGSETDAWRALKKQARKRP